MQVTLRKENQTFLRSRFIKSFYGYRKHLALTIMFIPVVLYFFVFKYAPMYGIVIAFKNYKLSEGILGSSWVGLKHFIELFETPTFIRACKNTVIISLMKLICGFPAPIILALLINEIKGTVFKKTVQTISYLPHFLSWVVLAGLFIQMLSPTSGPINYILGLFGIEPIYFLADNNWFRPTLVITEIWKDIGWGSILYLATISSINPELYEAGHCDGANRWQQTIYITFPELIPTITVMLLLNVGRLLDVGFDQVFNLYNTAVYETGDIIDTYVYRRGLGQMEYSIATAVGLFKNAIGFFLVIVTNAITKQINEYGLW